MIDNEMSLLQIMGASIAGSLLVLIAVIGWIMTDKNSLPPCPHEDSVSCYWDAPSRGNGTGRSFTVDASGNVTYTN